MGRLKCLKRPRDRGAAVTHDCERSGIMKGYIAAGPGARGLALFSYPARMRAGLFEVGSHHVDQLFGCAARFGIGQQRGIH